MKKLSGDRNCPRNPGVLSGRERNMLFEFDSGSLSVLFLALHSDLSALTIDGTNAQLAFRKLLLKSKRARHFFLAPEGLEGFIWQ